MHILQLLSYAAFFSIFAYLVVVVKRPRRLVAITLVGVITLTFVIMPPRAEAQGGLIAAIQSVLNVINGVIRTALTAINNVLTAYQNLLQTVAYPQQLINQARALVTQMINQYRGVMRNIFQINLASTTLANTRALETLMRDHRVNNFTNLNQAFTATYRTIPLPTDASPVDREMSDMDDALAVGNLKLLKATDGATDLEMQAADAMEDSASTAAPGSAPFLTAAAMASSIRSQAVTQKMLAAELRQEAAHVAHVNELRKHGATNTTQLRGILVNLLQHN